MKNLRAKRYWFVDINMREGIEESNRSILKEIIFSSHPNILLELRT